MTLPTPDLRQPARNLHRAIQANRHRQSTARIDWTVHELLPAMLEGAADRIEKIILFGSTARGEASSASDVDLLVIGDMFSGWDFSRRQAWAMDARDRTDRRFQADILPFTPTEVEEILRQGSQHLVLDALREGRTLHERK